MMQCWAHKPEERPSFTDIVQHLPEIMPQRLVTVTSCCDGIIDHLQYAKNEIIIVLDRWLEFNWNFSPPTYPDGYFWRGCMRNGRTGLFRPEETVAKLDIKLPNNKFDKYLSSVFFSHSKTFFHEKQKVQDKNNRKKLLISEPQGDVHHTCHIGVDGTAFGLLQVNVHFLKLPLQLFLNVHSDLVTLPVVNQKAKKHLKTWNEDDKYVCDIHIMEECHPETKGPYDIFPSSKKCI
ncbi:unnamed protein product [Onchocerca flexuosa]|uniref:CRIB domain-containing protein n=1 Tax=Onchocerca flexuosa TaxID=387005 RepID=A0A183HMW2_9BILA|nr:unnamed protein product [Onchocerca flexuosa]